MDQKFYKIEDRLFFEHKGGLTNTSIRLLEKHNRMPLNYTEITFETKRDAQKAILKLTDNNYLESWHELLDKLNGSGTN